VHATLLARLAAQPEATTETSDDDEAAAQPLALQLAIDVDDSAGVAESPAPDAVAP